MLGFDLLDLKIELAEIRKMNVRQLDYWAELKRAKDAVHKKSIADIDNERNKNGKH